MVIEGLFLCVFCRRHRRAELGVGAGDAAHADGEAAEDLAGYADPDAAGPCLAPRGESAVHVLTPRADTTPGTGGQEGLGDRNVGIVCLEMAVCHGEMFTNQVCASPQTPRMFSRAEHGGRSARALGQEVRRWAGDGRGGGSAPLHSSNRVWSRSGVIADHPADGRAPDQQRALRRAGHAARRHRRRPRL